MSTTFTGQAYAVHLMVTDTRAYDVVRHTAQTITVRPRRRTDVNRRDPRADQGPYPVVLTETVPDEQAETRTLRRRKDGTFRFYRGAHALRFTDEPPEERTDYRM